MNLKVFTFNCQSLICNPLAIKPILPSTTRDLMRTRIGCVLTELVEVDELNDKFHVYLFMMTALKLPSLSETVHS